MTPEEIIALGRKFMESRIFLTAAELDVFTILAKRSMSAREAADALKVTERGITILLDALASMGLLEKNTDMYHCPAGVASSLSTESPGTIIPMIRHNVGGWKRWSNLTEIVRHGMDDNKTMGFLDNESELEAFIGAMHVVAYNLAPGIVSAIRPGQAKKLLDIGGASGSYTQAFLEAFPGMTATLFDLPPVIKIAERRLSGTGLLQRITLVPGNFYLDELPQGYDLVLLSAIIHQNSTEQNIALYRKIYRALVPGGRIIIRDHVMTPDHTQPARGALFAVNMLVGTQGGGTYSFEEIRESLEVAGFINVRLIQPDERMNGLVEGFRP